jgi:hypothetical protein
MPSAIDMTNIDIPVVLRDRLVRELLHPRQAYYEIIEAALDVWDDLGGWGRGPPAV